MRCLNEKASAAGWVVAFCQCPVCESLRAGKQPGVAVEPDHGLKELQALRGTLRHVAMATEDYDVIAAIPASTQEDRGWNRLNAFLVDWIKAYRDAYGRLEDHANDLEADKAMLIRGLKDKQC